MNRGKKTGFLILLDFMRGNIYNYLAAVFAAAVCAALNLIPPYVIGGTIDSLIGRNEYSSNIMRGVFDLLGGRDYLLRNLYIVCAFIIVISIFSGLFSFVKVVFSNRSSERIAKKIRDSLYDHLQRLPFEYHSKADKGDLIQRCTSDVETIRNFLSVQIVEMTGSVLSIAFVFISMSTLSTNLMLISLIFIPFLFFFSFRYFKKIKAVYRKVEEAEGKMSNIVQENVNGVRVVKAFGQEQNELEKFDDANTRLYGRSIDHMRVISVFWAIADFSSLLQVGILLLSGVIFAVSGKLSIGILTTFITYEWMILWPVKQVGRILGDLGKTMVSVDRINDILAEEKEADHGGSKHPDIYGDIVFENVTFCYAAGVPVLKDISFRLEKGRTLGLLGPTGSGKSTLIYLLQRLYEYSSGSIKISGIELKDIDKEWLRRNIGIVLQEPFLYSKTIRDNIALSYMDAGLEAVQTAARTAAVHDVITEFDKGYETIVGEKGVTLSGGQKQRLAIARTIIKEKPILIFDDSLSAVDPETDTIIRRELKENAKDATKIIISHRINTLKDSDNIIVIEDGGITQSGTHSELLGVNGLYKRIFDVQNALSLDISTEVP